MQRRLAKVNRVLGLNESRPLTTLNARGRSLFDVAPTIRRYIADHGIGMIALDSMSRTGGGDLTENQPANKIIDLLSSLCPTWVALAHTSRADDTHSFGSIMFDAGADLCIQLASEVKTDENVLGISWRTTKKNDVGNYHPGIYAMEFEEQGLKGFRGAKDGEFPELEANSPTDKLTQVIDFIQDQPSEDATATQVANATGIRRDTISRLFIQQKERFEVSRKVKAQVFYRVKPTTQIPKAFDY